MLQLVIVKGPSGQGETFALKEGMPIVIGRGETCHIQLPDSSVSKRHCQLSVLSGAQIQLEDLESANGIFVNGILVKNHLLKPGDNISVGAFVFQLSPLAPLIPVPTNDHSLLINSDDFSHDSPASATQKTSNKTLKKANGLLDNTLAPIADRLASLFDIRIMFLLVFVFWSVLVSVSTVAPFKEKANDRIRKQSLEVAKLYARQLVRLNINSFIDQKYQSLISNLDSKNGETEGVIEALILDAEKNQVLSPIELLGNPLPNNYAIRSIQEDKEWIGYDSSGVAYVSYPIRVGTPQGDKTVATAFVVFNPETNEFSFLSIVDQALNSLFLALIFGFLVLFFFMRWFNSSIKKVTRSIDEAMSRGDSQISAPVNWPALKKLCQQVSFALGRSQQKNSADSGSFNNYGDNNAGNWATLASDSTDTPAAAFDSELKILSWNQSMEEVMGVRAEAAIGVELSQASRDLSFENSVREMCQEAINSPWSRFEKELDLIKNHYTLSVCFGDSSFLVTIKNLRSED